jgi:starvation-inducible DNA-binding protein
VCGQHDDLGTAALLDEWIAEAEERVWFLFETSRGPAH